MNRPGLLLLALQHQRQRLHGHEIWPVVLARPAAHFMKLRFGRKFCGQTIFQKLQKFRQKLILQLCMEKILDSMALQSHKIPSLPGANPTTLEFTATTPALQ
jgi:hypothetical protein